MTGYLYLYAMPIVILEAATVNTTLCIPKTYFATEPPINKCSQGILGAFSDALGLDSTYRDSLRNRLTVDAAMKLVAYSITPDSILRPQLNKANDSPETNLYVPAPVRSLAPILPVRNCATDGTCNLYAPVVAGQLRGNAQLPVPDQQDSLQNDHDEFSNLTSLAFSAPPSLTDILVKDTLAEYLGLLQQTNDSEKQMTRVDEYEPPRIGNIVNTLVNEELKGGAVPKINLSAYLMHLCLVSVQARRHRWSFCA